jgi:hypothetical protein
VGEDIFKSFNDVEFHLARMDNFMVQLGYLLKQVDNNNTWSIVPSIDGSIPLTSRTALEEIIDFTRFFGCQNFSTNFELLSDSIPYLTPVDYRRSPISRPNDVIDQLPAIRQMLPYFVVARLALDIPQLG